MEIIETLFLGYLTPRRKSSETDGREYLWTLCLFLYARHELILMGASP